jgi:uncharacterized protein HemX
MGLKIVDAWKATTGTTKIALVAILIGIVVVFAGGTAAFVDHYKDKQFDKRQGAHDKKVADLLAEREQHMAAIEGLKLEISELEGKKAVQKQQVEQAKADVQTKVEELKNEDQRYEEDRRVNDQPIDACERVIRSCNKAKSLGLYPADKACECQPAGDDQR